MADTSIPDGPLTACLDALDSANARVVELFPGELPRRQPVHTVYGGAHLFKSDAAQKLGAVALRTLREYAPDGPALGEAIGLDRDLAAPSIHASWKG